VWVQRGAGQQERQEKGKVKDRRCKTGTGAPVVNQELEKRLVQASIEIPKNYHHIVPVIPHKAQTNLAYSVCQNSLVEAMMEIGISAIQRIIIGNLAGPLSTGASEDRRRSEAVPNNRIWTTGAVILALGNFLTG
jgi:hypothetical protein